jgi:hypothetical protein
MGVVLPGLAGCSLLDPSGAGGLTTDQSSYTAEHISGEGTFRVYGFTLIARFVNRTDGVLYLQRCYPDTQFPIYGVELLDGSDSWGSAYDGTWACVGHEQQIQVGPGEARVDTLSIRGPGAFNGGTGEPFGALEGRMRLTYGVSTSPGDGAPSLPGYGTSTAFTVARASPGAQE